MPSFRTSLEWSRIEPREDFFDEHEIAHYRDVLSSIRRHGMNPVLALWHFTNPVWFADQGGWTNPRAVDQFSRYAQKAIAAFGDLVDVWAPFNEPMPYLTMRYLWNWGAMPGGPALYDLAGLRSALTNMVIAHAAFYDAVKQARPTATVVLINAIFPAHPVDPDAPAHAQAAARFDKVYNRLFADAVIDGRLDREGLGKTVPAVDEHLRGKVDVFGVNYYYPMPVRPLPFGLTLPFWVALPCNRGLLARFAPSVPRRGANGAEIYPPGIYDSIQMAAAYHLPIEITENGVSSPDGILRATFIVEHLRQVHRAIHDGFDVRGYFYWSPVDNYEWRYGFGEHFGLFFVDPADPAKTRRLNEGTDVFAAIARTNAISADLLDQLR